MKQQSRTGPRRRQSVSPTPRHLPLVDILIDTQAELQELVVASGLKVLEAMLEEDRAAVCGPRYTHQPARQASRTGHPPSQVVLGGRKVAIRRPRKVRLMGRGPVSAGRVFQVISGHAACATVPRSHVRWLGEPPPRRSDRVSPGGASGPPGGIVRLTLRPAQCRDEHSPAPLPSASLSARNHQPCRLALPQILPELPGC